MLNMSPNRCCEDPTAAVLAGSTLEVHEDYAKSMRGTPTEEDSNVEPRPCKSRRIHEVLSKEHNRLARYTQQRSPRRV